MQNYQNAVAMPPNFVGGLSESALAHLGMIRWSQCLFLWWSCI